MLPSSIQRSARAQRRLLSAAFARAFSSSLPPQAGTLPSSWQVVYASQTGNAQAFGLQLADNLPSCSGVTDVYELEPKELLDSALHDSNSGLVFIFSTFGKGEPTDSAKKFMAWLADPARDAENKALIEKGQKPLLDHLRFTVFGLGNNNTHAAHYNAAAKKLDARLEELGGQRVFPTGLGDDSKNIELDFEKYQNELLEEIKKGAGDGNGAKPQPAPGTPTPSAAPVTPLSTAQAAPVPVTPAASAGSQPSFAALAAAAAAALRANANGSFPASSSPTTCSIVPPSPSPAVAVAAASIPKPLVFSPPASSLGPSCSTGPQAPIRVVPDSGASCNPHLPPSAVASEGKRKMQSALVSGLTNLSPLGSAEFKPIYEVALSTGGLQGLKYTTGDHVSIMPRAPSAVALALCERLGWDPSTAFSLEAAKQGAKLPIVGSTTVRNALTRHVDVGAAITPQMLRMLSLHATDEDEKAALQTLASDSALYTSLVRERFIRLLDLLHAFPSVALPFDRLLSSWPSMVPRYYSISSSSSACTPFTAAGVPADGAALPSADPSSSSGVPTRMLVSFKQLRWALAPPSSGTTLNALQMKIEDGAFKAAAAVQRHNYHPSTAASAPKGFRIFEGLNSTYMAQRRIGDSLDIGVRPSNFRLPQDPSVPIVMIAGGIGVTPFRAFLEERMWQALQAMATGRASSFRYGPATLLFGCRNESDHVYLQMAQSALACGALAHYDVAYAAPSASIFAASPVLPAASFLPTSAASRGVPRLADQLVIENGARIWDALKNGGTVYLCGGASGFGAAVTRALKKVVGEHGGLTGPQADDYIKDLLEKDRFLEDLAD